MQIVIGGAFNGKNKWVRERTKNLESVEWMNLKEDSKKVNLKQIKESTLIVSGIEEWTKSYLENETMDEARESLKKWIEELFLWEKRTENGQMILIANDISKGIVPIDKKDRDWRDLTGWFYQDLIKKADRVDEIWYGLSRQLK